MHGASCGDKGQVRTYRPHTGHSMGKASSALLRGFCGSNTKRGRKALPPEFGVWRGQKLVAKEPGDPRRPHAQPAAISAPQGSKARQTAAGRDESTTTRSGLPSGGQTKSAVVDVLHASHASSQERQVWYQTGLAVHSSSLFCLHLHPEVTSIVV